MNRGRKILLTRRELVLGLLWISPRRLDELNGFEDVIDLFLKAGVARLRDGVVELNKEHLHPVTRETARKVAEAILESKGNIIIKNTKTRPS